MTKITTMPYTTLPELMVMCAAPGSLEIVIKPIGEHFVPLVYFTPPQNVRTPHGVIMNDDNVLAAEDLGELVNLMRDLVGPHIEIRVSAAENSQPTQH